MEGGFSFDGVDIASIGLEYAPDNQNTYVWNAGKYSVHEQKFDAHDGGYYYGTTMQPKDFTLRCIYEESDVREGVMAKASALFRRGRTGKLIFKQRPWCWYNATVVAFDATQMRNYRNGLMTVTLRAYYPFARTDSFYLIDSSDSENYSRWKNFITNKADPNNTLDDTLKRMALNSALLPEQNYQQTFEYGPITAETTITLFNPGTEKAHVAIEIAGDTGAGVVIANTTNGKNCRFHALSSKITSNVNKYIVCDGLNGKTLLTDGTVSEFGFLYHDYGFLELEPGYPYLSPIKIISDETDENTSTSNRLICKKNNTDIFANSDLKSLAGKYVVFIANSGAPTYAKIGSVIRQEGDSGNKQDGDIIINLTKGVANLNSTRNIAIVTMNDIVVMPEDEKMNLTKLNFRYKPTFA